MRQVPLDASSCGPCREGLHSRCTGWDQGFCGCTSGLCGLRLITGVMWNTDDQPNRHQGDS